MGVENTKPIDNFKGNKEESLGKKIDRLENLIELGQQEKDTKKKQRPVRMPFRVNKTLKAGEKAQDKAVVIFLNRLGKIEWPRLLPIQEGNMVIIKGKPYDANPKGLWSLRKARVLIIREIDRRPVGVSKSSGRLVKTDDFEYEVISNEDYEEVKGRGDATDSDEFLIKTAMSSRIVPKGPQVSKGLIIFIIIAIIGALIFFFSRGGA